MPKAEALSAESYLQFSTANDIMQNMRRKTVGTA
jgi:hypothetical protein